MTDKDNLSDTANDQGALAADGELTGAINAEGEQGDAVEQPADEEEPGDEEAAAQLGDFA
ncbi:MULTISPECIES: hypothetical protein [unclassified Sphingomonas]|uniref:hypothetical protein n=1 Tax=unclassified Sphingomonas TaxID=196159 RepID=UPI002269A1B8|nr:MULTISPECIES: hypothetical protein [unclassified Sphingomonas]